MDKITPELKLPGFRFHPTEEELLDFYLKEVVFGKKFRFHIIGFLNIYHHDPWDLPGMAKIGEREWYFFVPRDRKQGNGGGRPNRTTEKGFWKATGSDRKIRSLTDPKRVIGLKKTLVFYKGRAPRGSRTDWIMNEYRMPENCALPKEDIVLCKIYRKATSLKVLEQRAVMEEEMKTSKDVSPASTIDDSVSFMEQQNFMTNLPSTNDDIQFFKAEEEDLEEQIKQVDDKDDKEFFSSATSSLRVEKKVPELQLPKLSMDWTQDSFWTQLCSPWLDNFNLTPYANILNF